MAGIHWIVTEHPAWATALIAGLAGLTFAAVTGSAGD